MKGPDRVTVDHPAWMAEAVDWDRTWTTDRERMELAVELSRQNVEHGTGGPFGAAIFEGSGRLVGVGVNSVVRLDNSALHAEMVAFMMAHHRAGSFTLAAPGLPPHEVFTSCEPCIMCLGAAHWAGIRRIVCAAHREDAESVGFNEGAGCVQLRAEMEGQGLVYERGRMRADAVEVMQDYARRGGVIYGPRSAPIS